MRKTQRRKLYGMSRRRQRGGMNCRLLVVGAALVALQGAHAGEPGFATYVSDYIEKGDWPSSKALGKKLASYIPTPESAFGKVQNTFDSWQSYFDKSSASSDSCTTPLGSSMTIDRAEKVVEPYLLSPGERYRVTIKGSLPRGAADIGQGSILIFKAVTNDEDEEGNPIVSYEVQRASDVDDPKSAATDRSYTIPANSVELVPVVKGGRRNRKRKTLRRKK